MNFDFNYLATFLSLFYGLAIMQALTCISSYVQNYKRITDYWVWWIWAIYLIIGSCAMWMGQFERWHNIVPWKDYYTLYLTIHASLIYISFSTYFDSFDLLDNTSLESQYFKNQKPFFIFFGMALFMKIFAQLFILDSTLFYEKFAIIQCAVFILLAFINSKKIHAILAVMSLLLLLLSILS